MTVGHSTDRTGRYTGLKVGFEHVRTTADLEWLGVEVPEIQPKMSLAIVPAGHGSEPHGLAGQSRVGPQEALQTDENGSLVLGSIKTSNKITAAFKPAGYERVLTRV